MWDGNRQLQEQTDTHVFTTIYEQNSFEPVARLVWLHADLLQSANDEIKKARREIWKPEPELIPNIQVYHYHNDHLGTPNELTNQDGEVVWLADYEAWGNTAKVVWREEQLGQLKVSAEELQPLRFQGQFIDQETGLHYNRFRYYDPDLGMFTTRDPIGLLGGNNVFQYAPNPIGWVDPFGLSCTDPQPVNRPVTYRGDSRSPEVLFQEGFKPRGKSDDLLLHARDNTSPPSNFVSTSTSPEVATQFATNFGTRDGFVYAVNPQNGIDVNKALGSNSPYPHELEIAVPGGVAPKDILGATPVDKNGNMANYSILNTNR